MSRQLIIKDGKWYYINSENLDVYEVQLGDVVKEQSEILDILKLYIQANTR
jgi:hypothetical protein